MSIPEGWKLVPSTPTPEWVMAAAERGVHRGGSFALMIHDVLAAAPVIAHQGCSTCGDQGEIPSGEMQYQGEWQPPEPIMLECPDCAENQDLLPAIPQPAAHLTIPGALEWDGDNGTHGVVGTHSADGESRAHGEDCKVARIRFVFRDGEPAAEIVWFSAGEVNPLEVRELDLYVRPDSADVAQLRTQLAERDSLLTWAADVLEVLGKGDQVRKRIEALYAGDAPSKPKTCIECDQPYCHGVCVERGDQDYDRDQAAKGGDQ